MLVASAIGHHRRIESISHLISAPLPILGTFIAPTRTLVSPEAQHRHSILMASEPSGWSRPGTLMLLASFGGRGSYTFGCRVKHIVSLRSRRLLEPIIGRCCR